ncbi:histone acetyltransferase [Nowakowskiella sp. JEL0407]|nr:histone acetyltransferase [Nowakowskiella sp. JEL0407]
MSITPFNPFFRDPFFSDPLARPFTPIITDPFVNDVFDLDNFISSRINQAFSDQPSGSRVTPGTRSAIAPTMRAPRLDVSENKENYIIRADVPGMKKENISVNIKDEVLTIEGSRMDEHEEKDENRHVKERRFGKFYRSLRLPQDVDPDQTSAAINEGVLELKIKKKPVQENIKKIDIKKNSTNTIIPQQSHHLYGGISHHSNDDEADSIPQNELETIDQLSPGQKKRRRVSVSVVPTSESQSATASPEPEVKSEESVEKLIKQISAGKDTEVKVEDDAQNEEKKDGEGKKKDKLVIQEERDGIIKFEVVRNDNSSRNMILLTGLQNIIQKQLPNMPKEYIARLVFDRNHESMAVVKDGHQVVGGITYRLFHNRKFSEIVFCAIDSSAQVKGYGARLMSWVKDHVREAHEINHFLTYADNFAIGYFKKQGFSTEISLDKSVWMGYIKDYEGGTMMECVTVPKVKYVNLAEILSAQRQYVLDKIRQLSKANYVVHQGLTFDKDVKKLDPATVPGIKEAGWTPDMNKLLEEAPAPKNQLYHPLSQLVNDLTLHTASWPFTAPVSGVPDYYNVITDPMDLATLSKLVASDKYNTLDEFVTDARKIFNNCRLYNEDGTPYFKCANKLEKYFNERLREIMDEYRLTMGESSAPNQVGKGKGGKKGRKGFSSGKIAGNTAMMSGKMKGMPNSDGKNFGGKY